MGLYGSGKTVAIIDTDFANSAGSLQYEFNGKSINYYRSITVGGSASTNYHGLHVAGTIGANHNNNSSSYVTDNTNTTTYDTTNTRLKIM